MLPRPLPAYSYLLGLYLADGYIVAARNGVFRIVIMCAFAWPGLARECELALTAVSPRHRTHRQTRPGCWAISAYSRHWPCLFPQHGPGKKHARSVVLRDWQQEIVCAYPRHLLRGLLFADGWRGTNRVHRNGRTYEYPRYLFVNLSRDVLKICGNALTQLGISWCYSRRHTISVARREAVAALDTFVGP
jgi:hypothetical protein